MGGDSESLFGRKCLGHVKGAFPQTLKKTRVGDFENGPNKEPYF